MWVTGDVEDEVRIFALDLDGNEQILAADQVIFLPERDTGGTSGFVTAGEAGLTGRTVTNPAFDPDFAIQDFQGFRVYRSRAGSTLDVELIAQVDLADGIVSSLFCSDAQAVFLEDLLAQATAGPRFTSRVVALFGVVALILAAIGVHGTLAYVVRSRTREIGIRMALGAPRASVVLGTLRTAFVPVLLGGLAGIAIAVATARASAALLFEVSPLDAVSILAGASIIASRWPIEAARSSTPRASSPARRRAAPRGSRRSPTRGPRAGR